jgi:hypothetical protein
MRSVYILVSPLGKLNSKAKMSKISLYNENINLKPELFDIPETHGS